MEEGKRMIPNYAKNNFDVNDSNNKLTIINKLYHVSRDRITRQIHVERQLSELNRRLVNFERQYNEIKKLKSDNTTKGKLKIQLAIEELFSG